LRDGLHFTFEVSQRVLTYILTALKVFEFGIVPIRRSSIWELDILWVGDLFSVSVSGRFVGIIK
jgi:hypothetical protein